MTDQSTYGSMISSVLRFRKHVRVSAWMARDWTHSSWSTWDGL